MRPRARWAIAPLLAVPAGAWAFGLGQIELQSALNQPFRAEIAFSATAEELQGLRVFLADPDTFERRGLDRPAFLDRLEFRVVAGSNGRNVIQITSRESIAEPFVTLLVEATWPRGRNVREYTVLLDPPVLLPGPSTAPAVQPAETRTSGGASGGAIDRPAPPAQAPRSAAPPAIAPPAQAPAPVVRDPAPNVSSTRPSAPRPSPSATGGVYGPVQRAETLWGIANRLRGEGVSINQMMIALYDRNPEAFGGNINVLRAGATLRLPEPADFDTLATTVANAEVRRHTDEWQNRAAGGQLRLLPPSDQTARSPAPGAAAAAAAEAAAAAAAAEAAAATAAAEEARLLEIRNAELRSLQAAAAAAEAAPEPEAEVADPGVEIGSEPLFADEAESAVEPEQAVPAPAPAPATRVEPEPSLLSQAVGWLASPLLWIGLGVAALLLSALWFVRRRRQGTEDVTGRWEALQSEPDVDQSTRVATDRMRGLAPEQAIVVEEQHPERPRPAPVAEPEQPPARRAAPRQSRSADETLSTQTVMTLDQADTVAEADFHIAYGLYDQAAELVQRALEETPERRDLKLKLLEVYFMWGNKDAFLKAAQSLRADVGNADDSVWNKVVIMGRQICPDERLFTEATGGAGGVDVDLDAGDSLLDLAFDEAAGTATARVDFDLESTGERPVARKLARRDFGDESLNIGARTAAGLEAALFEAGEDAGRTSPDIAADSLAVTQESATVERPGRHGDSPTVESPTVQYASSEARTVETPTIERPGRYRDSPTVESPTVQYASSEARTVETPTIERPGRYRDSPTVESPTVQYSSPDARTVETPTIERPGRHSDWATVESPTVQYASPDARTVETPTIESPAARRAPAIESPTAEMLRATESPTIEQAALSSAATELTAEIDLDDLGLDVKDIEGLPGDLGDLPMAASAETDTRSQRALRDDALLSATGVTQVLHFDQGDDSVAGHTSVLEVQSGLDPDAARTQVLERPLDADDEAGSTALVKSLRVTDTDEGAELDLDLTALRGSDTVEQPHASSFSHDVFGGGGTLLDLDIGKDPVPDDDDPTGSAALDQQTMTEVGTKLDLARAYIDMGDPEGARSILEEVLEEGDSSQRREAQGLIDVLGA